jgi:transposase
MSILAQLMPLVEASTPSLAELVSQYRQLTHMIVQEKNRLDKQQPPSGSDDPGNTGLFDPPTQTGSKNDAGMCGKKTTMVTSVDVLTSLKGIGFLTACMLLAGLPEIGLLEKQQIVKLVGVAPINRYSDLMRGKRMITGGRKSVRNAQNDHYPECQDESKRLTTATLTGL